MIVTRVRNVNDALDSLKGLTDDTDMWRTIAPRGKTTIEMKEPHTTVYSKPCERVLFNPARDANPFFHLMEALWIMAGRNDVAFLARFNSQMKQFSDNGKTFHAPYGYRLRQWSQETFVDQVSGVIELLKEDPDTRRAVMSIWNPVLDLGTDSKDLPCNDLITFKLREDTLDMTVMCRSNDAILGAYGANAVQFSFLQEFVALAVGPHVQVGKYRQVSDSFHIYTEQEAWKKVNAARPGIDPYVDLGIVPHAIMEESTGYRLWLKQCDMFCDGKLQEYKGDVDVFFTEVAGPIMAAWSCYKEDTTGMGIDKNTRIDAALASLANCAASDWSMACAKWLERRIEV